MVPNCFRWSILLAAPLGICSEDQPNEVCPDTKLPCVNRLRDIHTGRWEEPTPGIVDPRGPCCVCFREDGQAEVMMSCANRDYHTEANQPEDPMQTLALAADAPAVGRVVAHGAHLTSTSDFDIQKGSTFAEGTVTVVAADGVKGHTTYRLAVRATSTTPRSIYAIYGDRESPLKMPPAFHVASPFGANVGGANAAFFEISPDVKFDSWLTVH